MTILQPEKDAERFVADLRHDLTRETVFDAMMRVRTSTGIRPVGFFGNIYMQVIDAFSLLLPMRRL